jgi:hypothetical protein
MIGLFLNVRFGHKLKPHSPDPSCKESDRTSAAESAITILYLEKNSSWL